MVAWLQTCDVNLDIEAGGENLYPWEACVDSEAWGNLKLDNSISWDCTSGCGCSGTKANKSQAGELNQTLNKVVHNCLMLFS